MAYARWGEDSDVYVYASGDRFSIHYSLIGEGNRITIYASSLDECIEKLHEAERLGLKIPQHTFERLEREKSEGQNNGTANP